MSNPNLHCTVSLPRNSKFVLSRNGVWYSETYIGGEEKDEWYLPLDDAEKSFSAALASVRLLQELSLTERGSLLPTAEATASVGRPPVHQGQAGRRPRSVSDTESNDPGGDPGRAAVEADSDSDPTLPGVTQLPPPAHFCPYCEGGCVSCLNNEFRW